MMEATAAKVMPAEEHKENIGYTERDAIENLRQKLAVGIQSYKNGDYYTLEEAWKEIDKI